MKRILLSLVGIVLILGSYSLYHFVIHPEGKYGDIPKWRDDVWTGKSKGALHFLQIQEDSRYPNQKHSAIELEKDEPIRVLDLPYFAPPVDRYFIIPFSKVVYVSSAFFSTDGKQIVWTIGNGSDGEDALGPGYEVFVFTINLDQLFRLQGSVKHVSTACNTRNSIISAFMNSEQQRLLVACGDGIYEHPVRSSIGPQKKLVSYSDERYVNSFDHFVKEKDEAFWHVSGGFAKKTCPKETDCVRLDEVCWSISGTRATVNGISIDLPHSGVSRHTSTEVMKCIQHSVGSSSVTIREGTTLQLKEGETPQLSPELLLQQKNTETVLHRPISFGQRQRSKYPAWWGNMDISKSGDWILFIEDIGASNTHAGALHLIHLKTPL